MVKKPVVSEERMNQLRAEPAYQELVQLLCRKKGEKMVNNTNRPVPIDDHEAPNV